MSIIPEFIPEKSRFEYQYNAVRHNMATKGIIPEYTFKPKNLT